jgi:topoisomerase IA-like protein
MRFKAKKQYGNYKEIICPFCTRKATQKNEQGVEVCYLHVKNVMEEIKCTCGSWLEQKVGKFGPYFNCINCGNLNFQKAMEIKEITAKKIIENNKISNNNVSDHKVKKIEKNLDSGRKEITITSNDVEYFS